MGIYVDNTWQPQWAWATFYNNSANTQTIAEPDEWVSLEMENGSPTWINDIGITTYPAGTFDLDYSGLYYICVCASFSGATNDEFALAVAIDGVAQEEGQINWTQKGGNYWEVSMSAIFQLESGQQIDIYLRNIGGDLSPVLRNITNSVIKLY